MTDAAQPLLTEPGVTTQLSTLTANLDTTKNSIIHCLFSPLYRSAFGKTMSYAASLAITFVPLLIGASCANNLLAFLYDLNVVFIFLVSFPCVVILTASDQQALTRALESVQSNGTVVISNEDQNLLAARWNVLFRIANVVGQALGVIVGTLAVYSNYSLFVPGGHQQYWNINDGKLLPVAYIYAFCIFLFYAVMVVYAVRITAIVFLLRDIVSHARIHIVPLHPDKAGGLLALGHLGLRNQYLLTLIGLNVVIALASEINNWAIIKTHTYFIAAPVVFYLILGPTLFLAPLLPFRRAMLSNKTYLMRRIGGRIRAEFERLDQQIPSGRVSKEDEELVERLQKIGSVFGELPVWPLDASILHKFFTAYIIPIFGAATYVLDHWEKVDKIMKRLSGGSWWPTLQ